MDLHGKKALKFSPKKDKIKGGNMNTAVMFSKKTLAILKC